MNQRLRNQAESKLLVAVTASALGDWLTTVALMVVFAARVGAAGTAIYMACRVVPRPLGAWLGGKVVDAWNARDLCSATSLVLGINATILALLLFAAPIGFVCVSVAVAQVLGAGLLTAELALVPSVTGESRAQKVLGNCNATTSAAMIFSPLLAIPLLGWLGPAAIVALDAATFLVAVALFLSLPRYASGAMGTRNLARPWRRLYREPLTRLLLTGRLVTFVLVTVVQASLLAVAIKVFGAGSTLGLLYAAMGTGAVAGSLAVRRLHLAAKGIGAILLVEIGAYVLANSAASGGVVLLLLFTAALCGPLHQVTGVTAVSRLLPPEERGAAMGVLTASGQMGLILGSGMALLQPGLGGVLVAAFVATMAVAVAAWPGLPRWRLSPRVVGSPY